MSDQKTLFIIGAGFSKQYKNASHNISSFESPVNNDFFQMVKKLLNNINIKPSKIKLDELFKYLCDSRSLTFRDDYSYLEKTSLEDMEGVLTELWIRTNIFKPYNERSYYSPLLTVMKELIAFTFGKALYGPTSDKFKTFARLIKPEDVILIFNYDLLFENALRSIRRFKDSGYLINSYKVKNRSSWEDLKKPSHINIFKLHGSINWARCKECNSLYVLDKKEFRKKTFDCNYIMSMKCPRCNEIGSLSRLIIPPIQTKKYNEQPFRYLWRRAANEIKDIKRIASLGYSLPPTDYSTRTLLSHISLNNESKIKLITMNLSTKSIGKYRSLLPITEAQWSDNIEDFIKQYNSWE